MKITTRQLGAIMPNAELGIKANRHFGGKTIDDIVTLLNRYAAEFAIDTPARWAHYLAQIAHESAEMRYTEELASGAAYDTGALAKRLGNTPEKDGDGQRYKGRGLIQLTGKANYEAYRKYCGYDVVAQPELLAKPVGAVRSSMWFWQTHGLNQLADRNLFETITRRINGGTNGLLSRRTYLTKAKQVLEGK